MGSIGNARMRGRGKVEGYIKQCYGVRSTECRLQKKRSTDGKLQVFVFLVF